jgi:16S rRNA G1207 methylase RsmC
VSEGLSEDDTGVRLLARALARVEPAELLLVHCGDLPGLAAGSPRLVLDVRERVGARGRAIDCTDAAAIAALPPMRHAAVWPRAHLGKDFTLSCLARGALALGQGGVLWCSARKQKGAESLADAMAALLGNVDVVGRDQGYRLMRSEHEGHVDQAFAREAIDRRYTIVDDAMPGIELASAPGVFSRRALDDGTRALIEHVEGWAESHGVVPRQIIDLCAGIGPLAIWAARRFPAARVLAVESNLVAGRALRDNVARNGVGDRVQLVASDGLPAQIPDAAAIRRGDVELALINPPTHAERSELVGLLAGLRAWMAPGARAFLVASRAGTSSDGLREAGAAVTVRNAGGYAILEGRWSAP